MDLAHRALSARLLLGGIAAALGLGATVTHVVEASADPATSDHVGALDPASLPAPGTYESCKGMFGLSKMNSDLASFDVVDGSSAVTPTPVVGTDIIPIVTISDGTTTLSCEAAPAWTDEATFTSDYLSSDSWAIQTSMPYPGTGYFQLPYIYGTSFTYSGGSITPTSRTIAYLSDLAPGATIVATPAEPLELASPYQPYAHSPSSSAALTDPFFTRAFAAILGAPNGSQAQVDYLQAQLALVWDSSPMTCIDQDPTLQALIVTMQSLSTGFVGWMTATDCNTLSAGSITIGRIQLFDAQVADTGITLTVSGPVPSTTTTTASSTTAAADPVIPAFTG